MRTLLLILLLLPSAALACEPACPGAQFIAPADGAVDVPTNTGVWLGLGTLGDEADWRLIGVDAATVPLEREVEIAGPNGQVVLLRPKAELLPLRRYKLVRKGTVLSTFRTGHGPDQREPAKPTVKALELEIRSSEPDSALCQTWGGQPFTVNGDGLLVLAFRDHWLREAQRGEVHLDRAVDVNNESRLFIGDDLCHASWSAVPGQHTRAGFAAVSITGVVGEVTEGRQISMPKLAVRGHWGPLPAAGLVLGFLVAAVGVIRRDQTSGSV